jgi:hypothetical protein
MWLRDAPISAVAFIFGMSWDAVSGIQALKRWKELLGWISRNKIEPMNSDIQRITRMACGFRNRERFRMAILFHFGGIDMKF